MRGKEMVVWVGVVRETVEGVHRRFRQAVVEVLEEEEQAVGLSR
jgi:hypothetical protein